MRQLRWQGQPSVCVSSGEGSISRKFWTHWPEGVSVQVCVGSEDRAETYRFLLLLLCIWITLIIWMKPEHTHTVIFLGGWISNTEFNRTISCTTHTSVCEQCSCDVCMMASMLDNVCTLGIFWRFGQGFGLIHITTDWDTQVLVLNGKKTINHWHSMLRIHEVICFVWLLTTGLSIGIGLNKQDIERWRQVAGNLGLFLDLFKRHGQVLLDWKRGLWKRRKHTSSGGSIHGVCWGYRS